MLTRFIASNGVHSLGYFFFFFSSRILFVKPILFNGERDEYDEEQKKEKEREKTKM